MGWNYLSIPKLNSEITEVYESISNSGHTLLCICLFIDSGIKVNPWWAPSWINFNPSIDIPSPAPVWIN